MAKQGQNVPYRPGVNRVITKKWAEAKAINYDDWDDSDGYDPEGPVQTAPVHGGQQSWDTRSQGTSSQGGYSNPPNQYNPSNRSVTGPSSSTGRPSFDRGDERRHFSNIGGAQGPYPTAQRDPFEEIQHDYDPNYDPQFRGHRNQPPLQLQTGGRPSFDQGPYPPGPYTAAPRVQHYQEARAAPFSAPIIGPSGRRSQSSGRPAPGEMFPRGESPMRPGSANSRGDSPSRVFPPRKSSLSQQQAPSEIQHYGVMGAIPSAQASAPPSEGKVLPFIRPADIYKRVEEEREKERRSQESSRPSFESTTSRIRESSVASHRTGTDLATEQRANTDSAEDADSTRRLQPTLTSVAERKSEYGFDNMINNFQEQRPARTLDRTETGLSKTSEAASASSDYTNRPDPTSASTLNSRQSPFDSLAQSPQEAPPQAPPEAPFLLPNVRGVSDFGSNMFGQRSEPTLMAQTQMSSSTIAPRNETASTAGFSRHDLQHQDSLGYRSMVNEAFDQSQEQVPPTPVSMSDSVARSNSASASDISPIIGRTYEPPTTQPSIPEEPNSRPGTSSTQSPLDRALIEKGVPAPPAIVPGYRQEGSPALSNNPDKRPLSIATADMLKNEHADTSSATDSTDSWDKDSERGPFGASKPVVADQPANPSAGASAQLGQPSMLIRTTSEDWREWEHTRKQFKTQHGVQDSMPSTPGVPSPVSRAESPAKGTVKDIAGKLDNNSGRNSPAAPEPVRPSNARLDSFRPSLPGGWQSYTTNASATTSLHEKKPSETDTIKASNEDDVPTAGPPKDHSAFNAPQKTAFAAAAAAGSALAGAFGVSQSLDNKDHDASQSASTTNSRNSTSMSNYERGEGETPLAQDKQLETIAEGDHRSPTFPLPPAPPAKDTPSEADAGRSTLDYFPAPLTVRQSRGDEQPTPQRPVLAPTLSTETSTQDDDNDRLRKEIVKSLTPKSSRFEDHPRLPPAQANFPTTSGSQRTVSTMGETNLPKEYDSYWNESSPEHSRNTDFEASTPDVPAVPQISEAAAVNVPLPETKAASSNAEGDLPKTTTLEQRFSWETAGEQTPPASVPPRTDSLQEQGSPDTIRGPTSAPTMSESLGSSGALGLASSVQVAESKDSTAPIETATVPAPMAGYASTSATSSFRERPLKDVLALNSPKERIQAFKSHRQHYATAEDGGLAEWLQSVGNSHSEHSTVMYANGIPTLQDDGTELHRPSPARLATKFRMPSSTYTGGNEASGTKQLQEDGKRLLKGAGKLGKMGGTTAKGLLAKGKDKFRTVSSGDKGILQNRRRSSGLPTQEGQHSSNTQAPPQSIAPHLDISPLDNDDWTLFHSTPRDERKLAWEGPSSQDANQEILPVRESPLSATTKYQAARPKSESFAGSGPFIGSIVPSSIEQSPALRESTAPTNALPKADDHTLMALEQSEHQDAPVRESRVPLAIAASIPVVAAGAVVERERLSTGRADAEKSSGLAAPDRHSMVSNVSSPSPSPAGLADEHTSRSISPPRRSISNQNAHQDTNVPPYSQNFPPTKLAEAEHERVQGEAAQDEPLPIYEDPTTSGRGARSRLGENPQIVPVADLSSQRRQETAPLQARPFSFAGPEALERLSPDAIAPPSAAIGETLNKQETNVSVDEVNDDSDGAKNRKSYSRPFGGAQEPNMHEHPAFRNPDAIDRTRMYSTESPLPSARREQASPVPRQNSTIPQVGEEGYRIPGPYVQEYRSPTGRQVVVPSNAMHTQSQNRQAPPWSPESARDRAAQGMRQPNMAALHGRDMGPPQQRPGQDQSKSRTFGGLFKREKSQQAIDPNMRSPKQEKRNSIFRSNSRQDSVSSQGSRLGSLRQTPSREQPLREQVNTGRRSSRNLLRASTGGDDDEYGRRKRFSGIGGFFGKSSSNVHKGSAMNTRQDLPTQGQSTYEHTHQQQIQGIPQQQVQRASTLGPSASISGRPLTEPPYHHQTTQPSPVYAPPTNGYRHPASAYPASPDFVMSGRGGDPGSNLQAPAQDRGFVQNRTGAFSAHPAQDTQAFDQRPPDLRINTGPGANLPTGPTPSTATVMQTRSPNNSYTHSFPSTRAPNSAGAGLPATKRAIDLHKRSRSPRLGRHSSSEDLTQKTSNDPAANLGTFSGKSRSPHTADREEAGQEKPWAISLPTDADERRKVQPLQRSESAGNRGLVAELPGSKADGYESDSPIEMSATAMPGSWEPDYGYASYDD